MATTKSGSCLGQTNLEGGSNKQMNMGGCMAGFFNFSHLLSPKRPHHRRLPAPLSSSDSTNAPSEKRVSAVGSPALSKQPEKSQFPVPVVRSPAPDHLSKSQCTSQSVSTFEFKEAVKSPWKFAREAPRLSLDSRAVVDAKGGLRPRELRINAAGNSAGDQESENQRRSPCVIARLMGLDPPPTSSKAENKVELRRSASESRSRDYRFLDAPSFLSPHVAGRDDVTGERKSDQLGIHRSCNVSNNAVKSNSRTKNQNQNRNQIHQNQINQRRYYNTADFFPPAIHAKQQQQHQAVTIYGEIERRLRMRGIEEPSKDLETLKHILEALQLKGLLHSSFAASRRSLVSERESPTPLPNRRRTNTSSSGEPSVSPRRERPATPRTPSRNDNRSSSPQVRRKGSPLSVEVTQRRSSNSPVQSPKITAKSRCDQNQTVTMNRSPRGRRSTVEMSRGGRERFSRRGPAAAEDEAASTVSESSFSASSHTEVERWRGEECREGKSLLERCDKLLHSIAEMNSNPNPNPNLNLRSAELQQPSPVSVLDSSFYKEDDSPSPVKKRSIQFKDQILPELEDELWSPSSLSSSSSSSSRTQLLSSNPDHHHHAIPSSSSSSSDDPDFIYISEVVRANYLPEEPDLFLLLEKQISNGGTEEENSNASFLHRRLIFDTVTEIMDRTHRLPPWKLGLGRPSLSHIWAEFQKIRECGPARDLFEVVIGVLKKDLAEDSITGWGDFPVEMSEAVLDIERLIFKDLIGESIQDLAALAGKNAGAHKHCRKLLF